MTVLEGLSWEGRTRVAGHLSGGGTRKKEKKKNTRGCYYLKLIKMRHKKI